MDKTFPRKHRLTDRNAFKNLFDTGKKTYTKYYTIYSLKNNLNHWRLGLVIGRKFGNAFERNHAKRIVREFFRNCVNKTKPMDYLILPKREILTATFLTISADTKNGIY